MCTRTVRYIEMEFTTAKSDNDCNVEQVLCWINAVGYRITRVDDVAVSHKASHSPAQENRKHRPSKNPELLFPELMTATAEGTMVDSAPQSSMPESQLASGPEPQTLHSKPLSLNP